jgi:hypothetical protein
MADHTDTRFIAAHLTAALMNRIKTGSLEDAATLYFDVLKAVRDEQARRHMPGTGTSIKAIAPINKPRRNFQKKF